MKRQKQLKRRQMLKLSGAVAGGSILAGRALGVTPTSVPPNVAPPVTLPTEDKEMSAVYKVVRPTGDEAVKMITQAPRLDTLEGKTICMAINGSFKSYVTSPVIEDLIRKKYPSLKVIPAAEMPRSRRAPAAGTTDPGTDAMIAALKQKGCQAVISGNGG